MLAALLGVVGCSDPTDPVIDAAEVDIRSRSVTFVRATLPSSVEPLVPVPGEIVAEVRDQGGRLLRGAVVDISATTGWISVAGAQGRWFAPTEGALVSDSTGRIRFRWRPDGRESAMLAAGRGFPDPLSEVVRVPTRGPARLLNAESAVPSGLYATCVLRGGDVGCVGHRPVADRRRFGAEAFLPPDPTMVDSAFTALHPLRLPASASRLVVMNDGACAHLTDGRLACWQDLGPRDEVPVVAGGLVFRDVARRAAVTADGTIGILEPGDTPAVEWRWRPLARDSALRRVLPMQGRANRHVCGLTSGGALRCAGDFGAIGDARVVPVVDAVTSVPIVATAGRLIVISPFLSQTRVHWIDGTGQELSGTLDAGPSQGAMATWPLTGGAPVGSTALRVERPDGTTPCRGFDGDPYAGCRSEGWRALADWGTITGRTSGAGGGIARICHSDAGITCVTRVNVASVGDPRGGTIVDTIRVR